MALAADIDTRRVQVAPTEGQAGQVPAAWLHVSAGTLVEQDARTLGLAYVYEMITCCADGGRGYSSLRENPAVRNIRSYWDSV